MIENNQKKGYSPPTISILLIEMEECISASSANVLPVNTSNQVQEDWTEGTDQTEGVLW